MYKIAIESSDIREEMYYSHLDAFYVNKNLNDEVLNFTPDPKDYSINMKMIQEAVTPIVKGLDVFISYDHSDELEAKIVATSLMEKGFKVFLDSMFWKSIDKALMDFNRRYNRFVDGSYKYEETIRAASTFHMILVDSIVETIKNSKVFLFINHSGSAKDPRTVSPWIYLENKVANEISEERSTRLVDSLCHSANITFDIDTFDYRKVDSVSDVVWLVVWLIGRRRNKTL